MIKYAEGDATVRVPGAAATTRPPAAGVAAPAAAGAGGAAGLGARELYVRLKIEREIYVFRFYMQYGGALELGLFVVGLFMFFGLVESGVASMIFMHLPHLLRPLAMFHFLRHWLKVQYLFDAALFDSPDPLSLLKRNKRFFYIFRKPVAAIVILTAFGTFLDLIHLIIRMFSFRGLNDLIDHPPKLWMFFFSFLFILLDAFFWAWFALLRFNVPKKYVKLLIKALRSVLGRGGELEAPPARAATEYDEDVELGDPDAPPTFTNFRYNEGKDSESESSDTDDSSGSSDDDDDDDDDDDGPGTPGPSAAAAAPPVAPPSPTTQIPWAGGHDGGGGSGSGAGASAGSPMASAIPAAATAGPAAAPRPQRLPPLERRGVGGGGGGGGPLPPVSVGPSRVFSPKGNPTPSHDSSDPNDSNYMGNIPGPAAASSSSPQRRPTSSGAGDGKSGYQIDVQ